MAGPLGGGAESPGAPTTYVRDVDSGSLGGGVGSPGAPTTYVGDVDGAPLRGGAENRELPPPMLETSMVGP
jgi:hypothetical protein